MEGGLRPLGLVVLTEELRPNVRETICLKALSLSRWGGGSSVLGQGGVEFSFGAWLRR
jgi:hypothetical protein